jgi:hypothetical protein
MYAVLCIMLVNSFSFKAWAGRFFVVTLKSIVDTRQTPEHKKLKIRVKREKVGVKTGGQQTLNLSLN